MSCVTLIIFLDWSSLNNFTPLAAVLWVRVSRCVVETGDGQHQFYCYCYVQMWFYVHWEDYIPSLN